MRWHEVIPATVDTIFVSSVGRPDLGGHVVEWGAALFDTIHSRLSDLDDDVIAVNKPAGMVVHAGAGQHSGTLTNALVHRFGQLSNVSGEDRPGSQAFPFQHVISDAPPCLRHPCSCGPRQQSAAPIPL